MQYVVGTKGSVGQGAIAWGALCLVALCACQGDRGPAPGIAGQGGSTKASQPAADASSTIWAALSKPCGESLAGLGSYRLGARSRLERAGKGLVPAVVEQVVELRANRTGSYSAKKTTDPQYGSEVIWDGQWIYSRLRHNRFSRRLPEAAQEPGRILNRFCGLLPAYLQLLAPSVRIRVSSRTDKHAGRSLERLVLSLRAQPRPQRRDNHPARRWRGSVKVRQLAGELDWDRALGIPLRARLTASWTFTPPARTEPATGIPRESGTPDGGKMSLEFSQQVDEVGLEQHIVAPPEEQLTARVRRRRLEIERQMVVGERPVVPRSPPQTR